MTRFAHIICLIMALTLAILASGVMMLGFNSVGVPAEFAVMVTLAVILAVVAPTAAAVASRRWLKAGQPLTGWLVFYAVCLVLAGFASLAL